jgi:hypothetical protein
MQSDFADLTLVPKLYTGNALLSRLCLAASEYPVARSRTMS